MASKFARRNACFSNNILFDLNDNINITDLIAPLAPVYKNKKVDFILYTR